MPQITIEISETVLDLLKVLTRDEWGPRNVEQVVLELIDHAQQGIYRPGAWEREWLIQAFGPEFTQHLTRGDPYGRPDTGVFQRPKGTK